MHAARWDVPVPPAWHVLPADDRSQRRNCTVTLGIRGGCQKNGEAWQIDHGLRGVRRDDPRRVRALHGWLDASSAGICPTGVHRLQELVGIDVQAELVVGWQGRALVAQLAGERAHVDDRLHRARPVDIGGHILEGAQDAGIEVRSPLSGDARRFGQLPRPASDVHPGDAAQLGS